MSKLDLLFTKDGLQCQRKAAKDSSVRSFFVDEETPDHFISAQLDTVLAEPTSEISVISAINHFTLMPEGFQNHDDAFKIMSYNSQVDESAEELMLSINKKFGVQFYYAFPKEFYRKIKALNVPTSFNFSGEKFLNSIQAKGGTEIHINLYHHQCEFLAIDQKKLQLYNNLDVNSEVDFLYFIMFTLSKIGFSISETNFYIYGETTENETFISELRKFVKNIKIVFDNLPGRNFSLN